MTLLLNKDEHGIKDPADLTGVTRLRVGVSWDTSSRGKGGLLGKLSRRAGADLDLLAIVVDSSGNPVRFAGLDNLNPLGDGTLTHSGDNQTGKGEGDDETVDVNLLTMKDRIQSIIFAVAAFKNGGAGQAFGDKGFDGAENVEFNVYDVSDGQPGKVAYMWPSLLSNENCCLIAKASRQPGGWNLAILNQMARITPGDRNSILRAAMNV